MTQSNPQLCCAGSRVTDVQHSTLGGLMKVAILAGGHGTRISEETQVKAKAMVEIGGRPILWHIMRGYAHFGFNEFVVALGYKGETIKQYMVDYAALNSNLSVNLRTGETTVLDGYKPDWKIDLIDTGLHTLTGGRIKRLRPYLGQATFMLTWCDAVTNVNLHELLAFHRRHGKLATLTAVRPPARYGHMEFAGDRVAEFTEKPQTGEGWINGAFFVLEPEVFDYIEGDETQWEREPLQQLARAGELMAFRHEEFWQCMDTLRERHILEGLWQSGQAPWKLWSDGEDG